MTKKMLSAPPPTDTVVFFTLVLFTASLNLPTFASLDKIATLEKFQASTFLQNCLSQSDTSNINQLLGLARLLIACTIAVTTIHKIRSDAFEETPFYLPGSKLKPAPLYHQGIRTQFFFTSWSWNLLGLSFFTSGIIPVLPNSYHHPYLLRAALIIFEIAAPSAILVSTVVTYMIWPKLLNDRGASGTERLKLWSVLIQHNHNSIFVILEIAIMGKIPISLSHAVYPPFFGSIYVLFSWYMSNRWITKNDSIQTNTNKKTQRDLQMTNAKDKVKERNDEKAKIGPQFVYFFLDTTLPGYQTTFFMFFLLCIMIFFFVVLSFSKILFLDSLIDRSHATNIFCRLAYFCCFSFAVCRFKD